MLSYGQFFEETGMAKQHNKPLATDSGKTLVWMPKLSTAADLSRIISLKTENTPSINNNGESKKDIA